MELVATDLVTGSHQLLALIEVDGEALFVFTPEQLCNP